MKKILAVLLFSTISTLLFGASVSYKNNTYQKLADEYTKKAQIALDAGHYDDAFEYSMKAQENAELSKAYIQLMMLRAQAEEDINSSKEKLAWAESIDAEFIYPMAYTAAKENIENAEKAFETEDFEAASSYARICFDALDGLEEITPLPSVYIVRPWAETKDCYWNISGRPYIYNNPLLWENLYQANKEEMPEPDNPNLIHPSMVMDVPSLTGEFRKGTYDPKKEYTPYGE